MSVPTRHEKVSQTDLGLRRSSTIKHNKVIPLVLRPDHQRRSSFVPSSASFPSSSSSASSMYGGYNMHVAQNERLAGVSSQRTSIHQMYAPGDMSQPPSPSTTFYPPGRRETMPHIQPIRVTRSQSAVVGSQATAQMEEATRSFTNVNYNANGSMNRRSGSIFNLPSLSLCRERREQADAKEEATIIEGRLRARIRELDTIAETRDLTISILSEELADKAQEIERLKSKMATLERTLNCTDPNFAPSVVSISNAMGLMPSPLPTPTSIPEMTMPLVTALNPSCKSNLGARHSVNFSYPRVQTGNRPCTPISDGDSGFGSVSSRPSSPSSKSSSCTRESSSMQLEEVSVVRYLAQVERMRVMECENSGLKDEVLRLQHIVEDTLMSFNNLSFQR